MAAYQQQQLSELGKKPGRCPTGTSRPPQVLRRGCILRRPQLRKRPHPGDHPAERGHLTCRAECHSVRPAACLRCLTVRCAVLHSWTLGAQAFAQLHDCMHLSLMRPRMLQGAAEHGERHSGQLLFEE